MRFVLVPFAAMICLARGAFPQPAFEAATIKPVAATRGISSSGVRVYPGGRIAIHALPLKALIVAAYDVGYWQLLGGADWMEKDVYDVEAKPAAQSGTYSLLHSWYGIGDERMRQMLQTERFHLKVHRETTTNTVYLLERSVKKFLPRPTKYTEDQPVMEAPGFSGEVEHVGATGSCSTRPCLSWQSLRATMCCTSLGLGVAALVILSRVRQPIGRCDSCHSVLRVGSCI